MNDSDTLMWKTELSYTIVKGVEDLYQRKWRRSTPEERYGDL